QYRTLPKVSRLLGMHWSPNANFITIGTYSGRNRVKQSIGPTISSVLDFTDGSFKNQRFVVEDDGFPNLLLNAVKAYLDARVKTRFGQHLLKEFEEHLRDDNLLRNAMLWLGAGMDAADGQLRLKRKWYMPWRRVLNLAWEAEQSKGVLDAMKEMHRNVT